MQVQININFTKKFHRTYIFEFSTRCYRCVLILISSLNTIIGVPVLNKKPYCMMLCMLNTEGESLK